MNRSRNRVAARYFQESVTGHKSSVETKAFLSKINYSGVEPRVIIRLAHLSDGLLLHSEYAAFLSFYISAIMKRHFSQLVPQKDRYWTGLRIIKEELRNPKSVEIDVNGNKLTILVEAPNEGFCHACTPQDV